MVSFDPFVSTVAGWFLLGFMVNVTTAVPSIAGTPHHASQQMTSCKETSATSPAAGSAAAGPGCGR
jgi:hypothetical protein